VGLRRWTAWALLEALVDVVVPQALPGVIATSGFAFVVVWDDHRGLGLLMSGAVVVAIPRS
jgi:ABC-type glycerol-3-phosphate transport system permease component